MCTILSKNSNLKEFFGYKVVLRGEDGHFYSSFTGQRYNKNWLPKITETPAGQEMPYWRSLSTHRSFFNADMVGRTFAFKEKQDARRLAHLVSDCYLLHYPKLGDSKYFTRKGGQRLFLEIRGVTLYGSIMTARYQEAQGAIGRRIVIHK